MEISKLEYILTLNVGGQLRQSISSIKGFYESYVKGIKVIFFDFDTWGDGADYSLTDSQLFQLGLDVEKLNDGREYWEYNVAVSRYHGDRRSRREPRSPEWV